MNMVPSHASAINVEPDPEATMTSEEAWQALVSADKEKDLDDFKVYFLEYARNNKELTFVDLENKLRKDGLGIYLVAIVFRLYFMLICRKRRFRLKRRFGIFRGKSASNFSFRSNLVLKIVELGIKAILKTNISATRGQLASTPEENLERLADAGFLVEDLTPMCFNCNQKGHERSECPMPPEGISPLNKC